MANGPYDVRQMTDESLARSHWGRRTLSTLPSELALSQLDDRNQYEYSSDIISIFPIHESNCDIKVPDSRTDLNNIQGVDIDCMNFFIKACSEGTPTLKLNDAIQIIPDFKEIDSSICSMSKELETKYSNKKLECFLKSSPPISSGSSSAFSDLEHLSERPPLYQVDQPKETCRFETIDYLSEIAVTVASNTGQPSLNKEEKYRAGLKPRSSQMRPIDKTVELSRGRDLHLLALDLASWSLRLRLPGSKYQKETRRGQSLSLRQVRRLSPVIALANRRKSRYLVKHILSKEREKHRRDPNKKPLSKTALEEKHIVQQCSQEGMGSTWFDEGKTSNKIDVNGEADTDQTKANDIGKLSNLKSDGSWNHITNRHFRQSLMHQKLHKKYPLRVHENAVQPRIPIARLVTRITGITPQLFLELLNSVHFLLYNGTQQREALLALNSLESRANMELWTDVSDN